MIFAAKLKLPGSIDQKMARVEEIIKELRLKKCENTKIGGIKGVSTKNGSYNKDYDSQSKFTLDPKYFFLDGLYKRKM